MKTTLTEEHWKALDRQIPIGETLGILIGQVAANVALGIRHPVIGTSELFGSMSGFCKGIQTGITVSRCNFERRAITKDYLNLSSIKENLEEGINKTVEKANAATNTVLRKLSSLPKHIQDQIMAESETANMAGAT